MMRGDRTKYEGFFLHGRPRILTRDLLAVAGPSRCIKCVETRAVTDIEAVSLVLRYVLRGVATEVCCDSLT